MHPVSSHKMDPWLHCGNESNDWDGRSLQQVSSLTKLVASALQLSPSRNSSKEVHIEQADIAAVQTALRAYGASDQVFIRCMLDGTIFTQRARAKFQPGVTGQCKYCQGKDGFEHRMWQCQHFEECRKDIPSADMAEINALPACARLHGWHLQPAEVEAHFRTLQHPCASEPVGIQREVQPSSKEILHLFLDGTCAFPRDPTRRFAAWAVCLAGTEHTTLDSEILCGGWVSGLVQTSLRAEITAAVKAIKWAVARSRRVHLWSGCQVVVRRLRHLLQGGSVKPMLRMLICGYRYIIGCKTQVMDRLKSLRWSPTVRAESGLQQWAYLRNIQLVDQAAGNINFRRSETFWKSWQAMDAACQKHQRLLGLVWQVALRIAWKVAAQDPGKPRPTPEVQGSSRIEYNQPRVLSWERSSKMVARYGEANVSAIHGWWTQIVCPFIESGFSCLLISLVPLVMKARMCTIKSGMQARQSCPRKQTSCGVVELSLSLVCFVRIGSIMVMLWLVV